MKKYVFFFRSASFKEEAKPTGEKNQPTNVAGVVYVKWAIMGGGHNYARQIAMKDSGR